MDIGRGGCRCGEGSVDPAMPCPALSLTSNAQTSRPLAEPKPLLVHDMGFFCFPGRYDDSRGVSLLATLALQISPFWIGSRSIVMCDGRRLDGWMDEEGTGTETPMSTVRGHTP